MAKTYLYPVVNWLLNIPAIFVDGTLYVLIGLFALWQGFFGSDEAEKWIGPESLFWIKFSLATGASIVGSLKMFRSSSYAEHVKEKLNKSSNEKTANGVNGVDSSKSNPS